MSEEKEQYLAGTKWLPSFMRDFHDQKDVFKRVDTFITDEQRNCPFPKYPSWLEAHIYVVDVFLKYMASHGYTLQKTRSEIEFDDIEEDIDTARRNRWQAEMDSTN